MKWFNIIFLAIALIVLCFLVLRSCNKEPKFTPKPERERERAIVDSVLNVFQEEQQEALKGMDSIIQQKNYRIKKDSISKLNYQKKIARLQQREKDFGSVSVIELINSNDSLKNFVAYKDTIISTQALRIDSMEVEQRIKDEMDMYVASKMETYTNSLTGERDFLRKENDKKDSIIDVQDHKIDKLEKSNNKKNWLIGFLAALNLVPRG